MRNSGEGFLRFFLPRTHKAKREIEGTEGGINEYKLDRQCARCKTMVLRMQPHMWKAENSIFFENKGKRYEPLFEH